MMFFDRLKGDVNILEDIDDDDDEKGDNEAITVGKNFFFFSEL
jgi:hypothetical protein